MVDSKSSFDDYDDDFLEVLRSLDDDDDDDQRSNLSNDRSTKSEIDQNSDTPQDEKNIRKRKSRYSQVPKVFRNDIRRLYAVMFTRICNHMDSDLVSSFFSTFCYPDLCFAQSLDIAFIGQMAAVSPHGAKLTQINKSAIASQFMNNKALLFPDLTLQLKGTKLHLSWNGKESRIESKMIMKATRIYDCGEWAEDTQYVNGSPVGSHIVGNCGAIEMCHEQAAVVDSESFSGKKGFQLCYTAKEQQERISQSPLLPIPLELTAEVSLTLHMDEYKRITTLSMHSNIVSFSVV